MSALKFVRRIYDALPDFESLLVMAGFIVIVAGISGYDLRLGLIAAGVLCWAVVWIGRRAPR